ncbi:MAG: bifunctional serine/threonine-protein kinase/ABC transporter substrate-binding protein [Nostoc sp.]|uniref:bifunctional serine/threonine-protein kinase/ABC transporter substrate-binding protein n=1 Tax=Nostoc sp. TaxID=1180 RepID=UPI002FFA00D6
MITTFSNGSFIKHYQVIKAIRKGNIANTYLAKVQYTEEFVIIKQFACQSQDPKQVEKAQDLFKREVQSLRRLNHDQIPKFIEEFTLKNQDSFLVQEYIEGETYHNCIFEIKKKFTEFEVIQFLSSVLKVLRYLHSQGITHRDISPDNIICRKQDKKPVVIDFGSIKQSGNQLNSGLSPTIILKQGYTPPEVKNENAESSSSSDLFSLAVTALVLLTGKVPKELFDINTDECKWSEITISSKLKIILIKMLQSQPNARYQTAREVLSALKSLSSIPSIGTQQTIAHRIFSSSVKNKLWKNPILWLTPCALVGLLIGVTRLMPVIFPPSAKMETGFLYKNLTPEQTEINQLINSQKFSLAISQLEQYRQKNPRNSQALIVLENAKIGSSDSIAIAVVAPITDDLNKAEEMIRGLAQAQWEVNAAGGINGLPIKIILVNDSQDQNTVRQTAQEIVNNQNILGIIGHLSSDNSMVASEVYQKGKILMISPTATSTNLTNKGEYIKRTVMNDAIAGGTLARYVSQKLQKKSIAIFYNSQNNYSKSIRQSLINEYTIEKGKIAYEADLSDSNFTAGAMVRQAKTAGADVIMLAADSSTLDKALQVMQTNDKRLLLIGGNSLYVNDPILSIGCSDAQGIILAVPWNVKNHLNSPYVKTASYLFKAEVSWRSKMSYDALSAIISALKKTPNHTRQSLQETISKLDFSAPSGDEEVVKFDRQGDRIKPVELVTVTAKADICTFEPIKIR